MEGLALIVSNVGEIVTGAISWVGSFLGSIMAEGNEILLLFILIPLGRSWVLGLVKRLMRV